jgi:hypothetical protein
LNKYSLIKKLHVNELKSRIFVLNKRCKALTKKLLKFGSKKTLTKEFGKAVVLLSPKEYKYASFVRASSFNVSELPFCRKKKKILRNRFFFRRRLRKLSSKDKNTLQKKQNSGLQKKLKLLRKEKKQKYTFVFLSFRKKKYRRKSSKSPSRKFFTNI